MASFSTSSVCPFTSTSPVGICVFTVPSARATTSPSTPTTYSLRTCSALACAWGWFRRSTPPAPRPCGRANQERSGCPGPAAGPPSPPERLFGRHAPGEVRRNDAFFCVHRVDRVPNFTFPLFRVGRGLGRGRGSPAQFRLDGGGHPVPRPQHLARPFPYLSIDTARLQPLLHR